MRISIRARSRVHLRWQVIIAVCTAGALGWLAADFYTAIVDKGVYVYMIAMTVLCWIEAGWALSQSGAIGVERS